MAGAAACTPIGGGSTSQEQMQPPGHAQSSATAAADPTSNTNTPICGTPPCEKYISRSETRTIDSTITNHPIATALTFHLAVSLVCGGVLCVWGEGFTLAYVQHEAHQAARDGECLRVDFLPQGREWQLVRLDETNQSPYCTD